MTNLKDNPFFNQHIISVDQFTPSKINYLFNFTRRMRQIVRTKGSANLLKGKVLANLFYEPSTRTSSSFIAAMERLGGSVISITGVQYSSVAKGESLPDTIRTLACYSDIIVLRHPEIGSAKLAASVSPKPIINAGDGVGEHPTQALLDLFTIVDKFGSLKGKRVVMVGDLKHGRTVHSLAKLLAILGEIEMVFVAPEALSLPQTIRSELQQKGVKFKQGENLEETISEADVLYVTRVQKERFQDEREYEKVKDHFVISPQLMKQAKREMILMHPLPRIYEITPEVDQDPRAVYLTKQIENGMYIRMALLTAVLGGV